MNLGVRANTPASSDKALAGISAGTFASVLAAQVQAVKLADPGEWNE